MLAQLSKQGPSRGSDRVVDEEKDYRGTVLDAAECLLGDIAVETVFAEVEIFYRGTAQIAWAARGGC